MSFQFTVRVVVELDIPWDSSQVDEYGESFTAWDENIFKQAVAAVSTALPLSRHALVVRFAYVTTAKVYHSADQRSFVHATLQAKYGSVQDFYLYKTGNYLPF